MLEYDRIGISEGTDVNETNTSKECDICHYYIFGIFKIKVFSLNWNGVEMDAMV